MGCRGKMFGFGRKITKKKKKWLLGNSYSFHIPEFILMEIWGGCSCNKKYDSLYKGFLKLAAEKPEVYIKH